MISHPWVHIGVLRWENPLLRVTTRSWHPCEHQHHEHPCIWNQIVRNWILHSNCSLLDWQRVRQHHRPSASPFARADKFRLCQSITRHHRIVRRHDRLSDRIVPCRNVRCHFVNHWVPHFTIAVHLMEAPRQRVHQLTHSLSHSHTLSSSSLYSLPHSSKEEEERRRKEKGLELGSSRRWPWRSPRDHCP